MSLPPSSTTEGVGLPILDRNLTDLWGEYWFLHDQRQRVHALERLAWDEFEETEEGGLHLLALSGVALNLLDRQAPLLDAIRQKYRLAVTGVLRNLLDHRQNIPPQRSISMSEKTNLAPVEVESLNADELPGIIALLGELGPGAIITEGGFACLFKRHPASIKRAVQRGELPPPTRLLGSSAWTVGVVVRHIEKRLDQAAKDAECLRQRIAKHSP